MVSPQLAVTFDCLARSGNAAAADLLLLELDASESDIRELALATLLARRDHPYQLDLLARWETAGERFRSLVIEHPGRLSMALRQAISGGRGELFQSACEVVLASADYEMAPALIAACERGDEHAPAAGRALLALADRIHDDWVEVAGAAADADRRREVTLVRGHLLFALERSLDRYETHRATAPLEAFLVLADRDNETLRKLLLNPRRAAHRAVVASLAGSDRAGVKRLLLSFLDDSQAPLAIARVIAKRSDALFVAAMLTMLGDEPSPAALALLKRVESIRWLDGPALPDWLSDGEQVAAVRLIVVSGMPRLAALEALRLVLETGRGPARRAASAALAEFHGAQANRLVLENVADQDPIVQAQCVSQLRERGIPSALATLLDRVDSPYAEVRQAAANGLSEFSFVRYLAAFETLSDEARVQTGALVRKIDPTAALGLAEELASKSRTRRLRAIEAAPFLVGNDRGAAEHLAAPLSLLLADDDPAVRHAAASLIEDLRPRSAGFAAARGGAWASAALFAAQAPTQFDLTSKRDPPNFVGFLIVVLFIAALAAGLALLKRFASWRERPARRSLPALFGELCRAHRLARRERGLLLRLARAAEVSPPARMFLEPEHFGDDALHALRHKLFGAT